MSQCLPAHVHLSLFVIPHNHCTAVSLEPAAAINTPKGASVESGNSSPSFFVISETIPRLISRRYAGSSQPGYFSWTGLSSLPGLTSTVYDFVVWRQTIGSTLYLNSTHSFGYSSETHRCISVHPCSGGD